MNSRLVMDGSADLLGSTNGAGTPLDTGERPFFVQMGEDQVYCILYPAKGTLRARVLVVGPFATERERSYLWCVSWARELARAGFEVLRFDYRGTGESSGDFDRMTFASWKSDVAGLCSSFRRRAPQAPLVLHGIRMGALLACEIFMGGGSDGLLLWAAPAGGREHLWDTMRRNMMAEMLLMPHLPPTTREELVASLEAGKKVNIDGYFWTRDLWKEAADHPLALPSASETRPWHRFDPVASPLPGGALDHQTRMAMFPFWERQTRLAPDFKGLDQQSLQWLSSWSPSPGGTA